MHESVGVPIVLSAIVGITGAGILIWAIVRRDPRLAAEARFQSRFVPAYCAATWLFWVFAR